MAGTCRSPLSPRMLLAEEGSSPSKQSRNQQGERLITSKSRNEQEDEDEQKHHHHHQHHHLVEPQSHLGGIEVLGDELLEMVLFYLDLRSLCRVSQANMRFSRLRWPCIEWEHIASSAFASSSANNNSSHVLSLDVLQRLLRRAPRVFIFSVPGGGALLSDQEAIFSTLCACPSIRFLYLDRVCPPSNPEITKALTAGLDRGHGFMHLSLKRNTLRADNFAELSHNFWRFRSLDLSDNTIRGPDMEALSACFIEQLAFSAVARLILRRCGIQVADMAVLAKVISAKGALRVLDLGANSFGCVGAGFIGEALSSRECVLTSLDLRLSSIGDDGAIAIAAGLKSNLTLRDLHLRSNKISDQGGVHFFNTLAENRSLKFLDVCDNNLGDKTAEALMKFILVHELQSLELCYNVITDKGVRFVAQGLAKDSKLLKLHLCYNRVTDEGAHLLAESLPLNQHLISLHLCHNSITDEGATIFLERLRENHTIQFLSLCNNNFTAQTRRDPCLNLLYSGSCVIDIEDALR